VNVQEGVHVVTPTVHIEPNRAGRWVVRYGDDDQPRSEHNSATEAEHAARGRVGRSDRLLLLLHDRYARVHVARVAGLR
jgi:hypothetical protein